MAKRILVCGGREFDDWKKVEETMRSLVSLCQAPNPSITIIQGGAKGADFLAKAYARYVGFSMEEYPADWKKHGRAAGYLRNKQMLEQGKPDLVIAFPGGNGTADMVSQAKKAGVEVVVIT